MSSPEEPAPAKISALVQQCGWVLQNRSTINLSAGRGIAIREAFLKDRDEVDYLVFVDGKAIGTVEAKPERFTLTGVEEQSGKYGKGFVFPGKGFELRHVTESKKSTTVDTHHHHVVKRL